MDVIFAPKKRARRLGATSMALGLLLAVAGVLLTSVVPASAVPDNQGDIWVQAESVTTFPGHQQDPHLPCEDINLWGAYMENEEGSYTIDSWPPSSTPATLAYSGTWVFSGGSPQDPEVMDTIDVDTLIANAVAAGAVDHEKQGFHFKIQLVQNPQKHKTFWIDCDEQAEALATVTAHKYEDANDNDVQDTGEANLSGWTMRLFSGHGCSGSEITNGATDTNGNVTLSSTLPAGDYSVREDLQATWTNSTPLCVNLTVASGATARADFGNFKVVVFGEKETAVEEQAQVLGTKLPRTGQEDMWLLVLAAGLAFFLGGLFTSTASRKARL